MDDDAQELAATIGLRVRHERQARGWTLDQLAEVSGLSRRSIINVEQGAANPSVGSLLRISDALGVGLPALVEPPRSSSITITPSGSGATLWTGDAGGRGLLVAGTEPPDVVELWDWTLGPGDRHDSGAHSKGTRELIHVHKGRILVDVGGETVTLGVGDAVSFRGDLPHAYSNVTSRGARFALTVFEPGVGSGPKSGTTDV